MGDMVEWSTQQMPRWHPVIISGYHIREAGSTAAAGARFHAEGRPDLRAAGGRPRPRRRRLRASAELLLQRADRLLRGDREVPCGAADLGARTARDIRGAEPQVVADAYARADGRCVADRAAAAEQHHTHRDRGACRGAGRHAVAAHQLLRRGAGAPDRGRGADRAAHAAGHRARDGRHVRRSTRSAAATSSRR